MYLFSKIALLLSISLIAACSAPQIDISNLTSRSLVKTEKYDAVDWRDGGRTLLVGSGGLKQIDLNSETTVSLIPTAPFINIEPDIVRWWQQDVVALYRTENKSHLEIIDNTGAVVYTTDLDTVITEIFITPESDLLLCGVTITDRSFGVSVETVLYRWNSDWNSEGREEGEPTRIILDETIIHPRVWPSVKDTVMNAEFALSPWGDELAFVVVHDPPAFAPYRQFKVIHLSTAAIRMMGKLSINGYGLGYRSDGEDIYVSSGEGTIFLVDEWSGAIDESRTKYGTSSAMWSSDETFMIDGSLTINDTLVGVYGQDSKIFLSPSGKEFVLVKDGWLYLVSGLHNNPDMPDFTLDRKEIERLRKWRALGLITVDEYLNYKRKVENNEEN